VPLCLCCHSEQQRQLRTQWNQMLVDRRSPMVDAQQIDEQIETLVTTSINNSRQRQHSADDQFDKLKAVLGMNLFIIFIDYSLSQ
jgi:hypothetical protein